MGKSYQRLPPNEKVDLKRYSHSYAVKYDNKPSDILTLEIDAYGARNIRKRFADGKKNHVEDYLLDFMISVIKIADIRRSERIKREAEQKQREEERERLAELQRLPEIEDQRLRNLEKQADLWFKSSKLREFINAVKAMSSADEYSEESKTKISIWIEWAKAHADRLDPLSNGLSFEID